MVQGERTRPRDPEAATQALLDAAREIFARVGFEGARIDEIAATAGYNKALIFRYFGDKVGLYRAVVAQSKRLVNEEISKPMMAIAADPDAPLDAARVRRFIEEAVRLSFDFYAAHPSALRMMSWEAAECWRTFSATHAPGELGNWMQDVCAFARKAQQAGLIRPDLDPRMLIANTISLTFGYHSAIPRFQGMFPAVDLTSAGALEHAREEIVRFVLHGTLTLEGETQDATRI